jgi:TM2 domain-containing membrane protein YozV
MTEEQPEGQWGEQPAAEGGGTAPGVDGEQPAALEPYAGQPPAVQPPEPGADYPAYPAREPYPGQQAQPTQPYPTTPYPGQQPYGQPGYAYPGTAGQPYGSSPYAAAPPAGYGYDPVTGLPWSDKTRTTAGLLQLLLPFAGICGVGRLYAGQIGIGLVQLIGFVVGVFLVIVLVGLVIAPAIWLWSVVDGIVLLASGGRDGYGRPLR